MRRLRFKEKMSSFCWKPNRSLMKPQFWRVRTLSCLFAGLGVLLWPAAAFALDVPSDNSSILSFLNKFSFLLHPVSVLNYFLRQLGWLILIGIGQLVDLLDGSFQSVLKTLDFFHASSVQKLLGTIKPLEAAILVVVFAGLGLFLIIGARIKYGDAIIHLFLMALIILALPSLMDDMLSISKAFASDNGISMQTGTQTILNNVTDIYTFAQDDFRHTSLKKELDTKSVDEIDITEIADPNTVESLATTNGKYIEYKIGSQINNDGSYQTVAVKKNGISSWLSSLESIFGDYYYRYTWHFWTALVTLLVDGLVLLLSMLKMAGIGIDLAFNQIFATVLSFFDVFSMAKFRRVIENIFAEIATVICICAMISLFSDYTAWLNTLHINALVQLIALAAAGIFVINGPDQFARVFGVDAGVSAGWGMMGGLLGVKAAGGMAGKMMKKGAGLMAGVAGAVAGAAGMGKKTGNSRKSLLHANDTVNGAGAQKKGISGKQKPELAGAEAAGPHVSGDGEHFLHPGKDEKGQAMDPKGQNNSAKEEGSGMAAVPGASGAQGTQKGNPKTGASALLHPKKGAPSATGIPGGTSKPGALSQGVKNDNQQQKNEALRATPADLLHSKGAPAAMLAPGTAGKNSTSPPESPVSIPHSSTEASSPASGLSQSLENSPEDRSAAFDSGASGEEAEPPMSLGGSNGDNYQSDGEGTSQPSFGSFHLNSEPRQAQTAFQHPLRKAVVNQFHKTNIHKSYVRGKRMGRTLRQAYDHNDNLRE
ncbi:pLS20_p028 family conjugation system transmembrane protein [Sporolactobacillus sp. KGMB 08714]|uniref:pLS20_p028 family conjugation system transmembrane protein n=1 Tax=Sporolactobacillus sp. KGMB 08714 TaxID=3064704 RepID=UPI002FBDF933